ncbi:hypothetical protein HY623_02610 [Candidatus Uhrbacteria bacterium]|nr:hypothetical protein [Candidatus Uhrbacteria bacterium]
MDNIVGSLTQVQKSVIVGTLLGDGYARIVKGRRNVLLEINHSYIQKEYVDWKYSILKNISTSGPKIRRGNNSRIAYRFTTRQHPEITKFYNLFYKEGKKVVPTITLNPLSLAVWFMDDGSKCRDSDFYLNTQQFTPTDQSSLLAFLKDMGLNARLNKDKTYYRVRFMKESVRTLKGIVAKFVIPSMKYKIE